MPFTPPLERLLPNRDAVVEDGIPIVVTILFGFSGSYFAAAAAFEKVDPISITIPPYLPTAYERHFTICPKAEILFVTALSCFFFYLSFRSALYAKMHNIQHVLPPAPTGDDVEAIERNNAQRQQQLLLSLITFNLGILVLPFAILVFLPNNIASASFLIYVIFAIYRTCGEVFGTWRGICVAKSIYKTKYPQNKLPLSWF